MAAETGFMIDGSLYEMPSLDTFTMEEAQILYDYSGLGLEDFALEDDDDEFAVKLKNPGFLRALMHIAYRRGNPKQPDGKVRKLIGAVNLIEAHAHLAGGEDDADPPVLTPEPDGQSLRSSGEQNATSGAASPTASDGQDSPPVLTGTTRSGTSFT